MKSTKAEQVQSVGGAEVGVAILNRVRGMKRWHLSKALKKIKGVSYVTFWRKSKGLRSGCSQCFQGTTKVVRVEEAEWARERRRGGEVREIRASAGRVLQVIVRIGAFRINETVAIALLSKAVAESDHSPLCSLWSENSTGRFSGYCYVLLHWRPLQASGSSQMTYRPTPSWPGRGWGRERSPTAYVLNNMV